MKNMNIKQFTWFLAFCMPLTLMSQDLQEGLVAWYQFNGGVEDQSPFEIEGVGFNLQAGMGLEDEEGTCFEYNGDDAYTYLSEDNRSIQNHLTISAWVKTTDIKRQFVVCKYYSEEDKGYFLAVDDGLALIGGRNASGNFYQCLSTTRVNDGKWHHLAGVIEGDNWEIWIDCQLENTIQSSGITPNLACTHPLTIGNWHEGVGLGTPRFYHGLIDEVRIYNRAVEENEMELLCNESLVATESPESTESQINIYPVPGTDVIHFEIENKGLQKIQYQLFENSGKMSARGEVNNHSIQIDHLPPGLYFLQLFQNGKLIGLEKVIKQGVRIP